MNIHIYIYIYICVSSPGSSQTRKIHVNQSPRASQTMKIRRMELPRASQTRNLHTVVFQGLPRHVKPGLACERKAR